MLPQVSTSWDNHFVNIQEEELKNNKHKYLKIGRLERFSTDEPPHVFYVDNPVGSIFFGDPSFGKTNTYTYSSPLHGYEWSNISSPLINYSDFKKKWAILRSSKILFRISNLNDTIITEEVYKDAHALNQNIVHNILEKNLPYTNYKIIDNLYYPNDPHSVSSIRAMKVLDRIDPDGNAVNIIQGTYIETASDKSGSTIYESPYYQSTGDFHLLERSHLFSTPPSFLEPIKVPFGKSYREIWLSFYGIYDSEFRSWEPGTRYITSVKIESLDTLGPWGVFKEEIEKVKEFKQYQDIDLDLPNLEKFVSDYGLERVDLETLKNHINALENKVVTSIEILGQKIPVQNLGLTGLLAIFFVSTYLLLHITSLTEIRNRDIDWNEFSWITIYPGALALALSLFSILILPIGACILVIFTETLPIPISTSISILVLAVGILTSKQVRKLRTSVSILHKASQTSNQLPATSDKPSTNNEETDESSA